MDASYKIHLEQAIGLARSLIMKFEVAAVALNKYATDYGHSVETEKSKWRYYQHLAGNYHTLDTPMTITSLDDGSTIVFSKANLSTHKKTLSLYKKNYSYVRALMDRYPMQANLVKGVLWPIPTATAVAAPEGAVLYYDTTLVEPQEHNLISDIETWVKQYIYRYFMESYSHTDDLFTTALIAEIYSQLVPRIIAIRFSYIRTAQVHSFHLKQYLASHNELDIYMPYLTYAQQLWLYMNIAYIERHSGFTRTFDLLIEQLFTARNLPVYKYELSQQSLNLDTTLQPTPVFVRTPINLNTTLGDSVVDTRSILEVVTKESTQAKDNAALVDAYVESVTDAMSVSGISTIPTKLLEAAAIDPEDMVTFKLIDIVLNEWPHLAKTGHYKAVGDLINPISGDTLKLDALQLYTLFLYAFMRGYHAVELTDCPQVLLHGLAKQYWFNPADYKRLLPDDPYGVYDETVDMLVDTQYELLIDPADASSFIEYCTALLYRKRVRFDYIYRAHRLTERAFRRMLFDYSYCDSVCDLRTANYTTYEQFFTYIGLDYTEVSDESWADLALSALDAATHFESENIISLREIQSAMVRLIKQLSSYTIQFVESIVSTDTIVADPNCVVPDTTQETTNGTGFADIRATTITYAAGVDVGGCATIAGARATGITQLYDNKFNVNIGVVAEPSASNIQNIHVILPTVTILV